jgi:polysaccharide biosynthesis/export protein
VYFSEPSGTGKVAAQPYKLVFKKDDLLNIQVMAMDPEAVIPFNLPLTQQFPSNIGGYMQGAPTPPGYLVDSEGNIDLPVIGKVKAAGFTRTELAADITEKLIPYLSKPTVNIRLLNYRVTVLGEVRNPGTFTIPNEKVTLTEALGIAGDLLITGVRNNVTVIRHEDGKQTEIQVDLRSKNIFDSPAYYLQQGDVVYVQPNRAKVNSSVVNPANIGLIVSTISLIISTLTLINTR